MVWSLHLKGTCSLVEVLVQFEELLEDLLAKSNRLIAVEVEIVE